MVPNTKHAKRVGWLSAIALLLMLNHEQGWAQHIKEIKIENQQVVMVTGDNGSRSGLNRPLISFEVNGKPWLSDTTSPLQVTFKTEMLSKNGIKGVVSFMNTSPDTLSLSNVAPFGRDGNEAYIMGHGDHRLSRTHLFCQAEIQ